MLTFIFLNILVILSSYFFTVSLLKKSGKADLYLCWFIFYLAQIVFVDLVLGIWGFLMLRNILFFHVVIFILGYLLFKRQGSFVSIKIDFSFITESKILSFATAVFLGFFIVKGAINLFEPPNCPDSWQYHLSFPATWIRNANINNPFVPCGPKDWLVNFVAMSYFPMSAEFYFHWLMAPLRNAFIADSGQLPFYLVGVVAIFSILRKFGVSKIRSWLLGLCWVLIPNLFKQIDGGAQVDIICAAVFLVLINMLIILGRERSLKNFFIFSVTLGIFISLKGLNIFWAVSIAPLFFYELFSMRENKLKAFLIVISVVLAIGGYSFINNLILTGNVFYPVTFKVLGKVIMPGIIDRAVYANQLFPWAEFRLRSVFFSEGLGGQLFLFVLPGIIIPLVYSIKNRKLFYAQGSLRMVLLFAVPLIMLIQYFLFIQAFWLRYFFPFFGAAIVCFGIFLERFGWGRKYVLFFGSICVISSMAEFSGHLELIVSLTLSAFLLIIILNSKKIYGFFRKHIPEIFLLPLVIFIIIGFLFIANAKYEREEAVRYGRLFRGKEAAENDAGVLWEWIHNNTLEGKRIAYTGRGEFYPLFGRRLVNDVFYVSVNKTVPLAHNYPGALYRAELDEKAWLKNIFDNKVDLLVVYLPHQSDQFPVEDEWAMKNKNIFNLVYENSKARVYEVKR